MGHMAWDGLHLALTINSTFHNPSVYNLTLEWKSQTRQNSTNTNI